TNLGQAADSTYTGASLGAMGALWNYGTAFNQYSRFDNVVVQSLLRPPSITAQPPSQLVVLNTGANLTVGVAGARPLRFQWIFNGAAQGGQTNATLSLPNFQVANEGDYWVVVTNAYGAVTSSVATLTVSRDYGDAPDGPYRTYRTNDGARHVIVA